VVRKPDPTSSMETVLKTISRYQMLRPGYRVVVAVSGGPDSVCLFHLLRELAPRLGVIIDGIAHLNHKLRGEASEEDECFVAALAAQFNVPFYLEKEHVADAGGNLEQSARRARQAFFERLIREGAGDCVATGHTRDDQAETVLFRILRGSGLSGLAGILPVTREGLIRPLLEVTRAEVKEFLRARGIAWREDETNLEPRFARNRIRNQLLPQLAREWNPHIREALAHLADLAGEEERWWSREVSRLAADLLRESLLRESYGGIEVQAPALAALPRAAARRLIRHVAGKVEFEHVERVLDLALAQAGEGRLELPGRVVIRSFDWLRFEDPNKPSRPAPVRVEAPGRYAWAGGNTEVCFEVSESKRRRVGCASLKLSERRIPASLELRGWRAGDHYRPVGHSRDQKIKDLFQQARVPSWRRDSWPIVCSGSKILWVRDFGASAEFAAGSHPGPELRIWEENAEA
jgi:tRNA(Ile)-lysidine synthase